MGPAAGFWARLHGLHSAYLEPVVRARARIWHSDRVRRVAGTIVNTVPYVVDAYRPLALQTPPHY